MLDSGRLKKMFQNRETVFGAWTSLSHPSITEIFSEMKVDLVGIDIEHSTISLEQSQRIIAAAHSKGAFCLPRIASHNMEAIKRLLDSGADGIIAPMVSTPSEVENLISWVKYPPLGKRSFGISRAQNYGFDFGTYTEKWNGSSSLIIQIESAEGVANIEKLISYDDVDGVMIGPYDLSGSLGVPGQIHHAKVQEACAKVIAACKKKGKSCGTQLTEPDLAGVQKSLKDGFNFIVLSSDIFLLWKWSAKMRELIGAVRG